MKKSPTLKLRLPYEQPERINEDGLRLFLALWKYHGLDEYLRQMRASDGQDSGHEGE